MKLTPRPPFSFRSAPNVPQFDDNGLFTVMDATCGLCAKGAKWIARNDHTNAFQIIPVQSKRGAALLTHYGLDPDDPASWLFIENGHAFTSIDAMIRVGGHFGGIWHSAKILRILPRTVQDFMYGLIARNRYRFFWLHRYVQPA